MPTPASYSPNNYVTLLHQTPHLSSSLTKTSNDFDPSSLMSYGISVAIFPLIILGLGIVSIIAYQIILIGRYTCCKSCCSCGDEEKEVIDIVEMDRDSINKRNSNNLEKFLRNRRGYDGNLHYFYYFVLTCAVAAICCVFFGSINIVTVITNISAAVLSLSDSFALISSTTTLISSDGSNTINILNSFECTNMSSSDRSTIIDSLHTLITDASSINQQV